jgi:hypothetical protein
MYDYVYMHCYRLLLLVLHALSLAERYRTALNCMLIR